MKMIFIFFYLNDEFNEATNDNSINKDLVYILRSFMEALENWNQMTIGSKIGIGYMRR